MKIKLDDKEVTDHINKTAQEIEDTIAELMEEE